jgi:hypothetical protein
VNIILEALDVPPAGWSGRRRFVAVQLARMAVEGLVFVLLVGGIAALLVTLGAAADALPGPR